MKKFIDTAALALGWTFAIAAVFLLLRPGGLLRSEIDSMLADRRRDRIVAEEWPRLVRNAPGLGAENPPPFAIEFIDYQCIYCRQFHQAFDSIMRASESEFRLAIRHNPNPANPISRTAALASICAQFRGGFELLHNYLIPPYSRAVWKRGDVRR